MGPLTPVIVDAKQNGFDDVLWLLDGYIKELTFINIFVLWKSRRGHLELLTPPATEEGCLFNGTLRQTVIELAQDIEKDYAANPVYNEGLKGQLKVLEREVSVQELISA